MSFSESLDFDVSAALRSIDQIEDALNRATTQFRQGVAVGIDDLRGVSIDLAVDRDSLTRQINAAVDAADESIVIDADTSSIGPEIDRVVPPEIEVEVDADTTEAQADLRRLGDSADRAGGDFTGLRNAAVAVVAGIAATAVAVRTVIDAYSALEEQVSGAEVVFGDLDDRVVAFATNASGIGLAASEALAAANAFGLFAQNAGLAGQEAADFATQLVTRAADIASLRDLDLSETLDRLRSGLTGETEPLRSLGVFLNEANVQAKALELGLADLTGEVDDAGKIQARFALIMEQSSVAAGNFALTSDGLANTQRRLSAEFQNALAAIGEGVAPAFQELLAAGEDLIPTLTTLGLELLPTLVEIATSLAPALGGGLDVLIALTPALDAFAAIVQAIPEPLLVLAGIFGTLQASSRFFGAELVKMIPRLAGVGASAGVAAGALALLSIALVAAGNEQAELARQEQVRTQTLQRLNSALATGLETQEAFSSVVADAARDNETLARSLEAIGASSDEFAQMALGAGSVLDVLLRLQAEGGRNVDLTDEQTRALAEQAQALRTAAELQLIAIANQSDANAELVAAAEAQNTFADGSVNVGAALEDVNEALAAQEAEAERLQDRYQGLIGSTVDVAGALRGIRTIAPEVADAIQGIRAGDEGDAFLNLAGAITEAELSAENLAVVANILGVDVNTLTGFVDGLNSAMDDFVSSAVAGLPTVADVFDDVQQAAQDSAGEAAQAIIDAANDRIDDLRAAAEASGTAFSEAQAEAIMDEAEAQADNVRESGRVTAQALAEGLAEGAFQLQDFRANLAALTEAGFGDLASLAAEQGGEAGQALAEELATALEEGNVDLLNGLRFANDIFREESLATVDFIRDELAPEMLSATGILASAITESFGEGLDFEERVQLAGQLAATELDAQGQSIAAVALTEGEDAARAFGEALGLEDEAIEAALAAARAIQGAGPNLRNDARNAGKAVPEGFAAGIRDKAHEVQNEIDALAAMARAQMQLDLGIKSPSTVFAEFGADSAEGFALGIESGMARVQSATSKLATGAIMTAGRPASPGGFDSAGMIDAVSALAGKVGDTNTWNISGADGAFATASEIVRRQRNRKQIGLR